MITTTLLNDTPTEVRPLPDGRVVYRHPRLGVQLFAGSDPQYPFVMAWTAPGGTRIWVEGDTVKVSHTPQPAPLVGVPALEGYVERLAEDIKLASGLHAWVAAVIAHYRKGNL